MVDVVALESDQVVATGEVKSPVVTTIAGCGPGGRSVDITVGNSDSAGSKLSKDDVLASNALGLTLKSITAQEIVVVPRKHNRLTVT
jgi:hypothetical protein